MWPDPDHLLPWKAEVTDGSARPTVRGCPCPVAGRSLRHPAFAHSMLTALRHPACACQQRRLSGHGQPLTDEVGRIHEKHDIVSFFLRKRSLLVLRMASCHANQRGRAPRTPKRASGASAQQAHHRPRRGRRAAVRAERVRGVRPGEPMRPVSTGATPVRMAVANVRRRGMGSPEPLPHSMGT
jgi:hypothetical protein